MHSLGIVEHISIAHAGWQSDYMNHYREESHNLPLHKTDSVQSLKRKACHGQLLPQAEALKVHGLKALNRSSL
jgi:hypothetical protein